jgi:two-component system chemotaxis response regulator CheB
MKKKPTKTQPVKASPSKRATEKKFAEKSDSSDPSFYVVVIGASAGGLNAVSELVSRLPSKINAAIFVVLHLSKTALSDILFARIKKNTSLICGIAVDNEPINRGHIYIAGPDAHLLVKDDKILIGHGPPENRFRPSIDVLFRSAAAYYRERTIGIILTGFLNDGASGMLAIKQSGGHCILQDPNEAEYPDMPLSVLETIEVDHCVPLKEMGKIIVSYTEKKVLKSHPPPEIVTAESRLSEKNATGIEKVSQLGEKTVFTCPDCGGSLWKIENGTTKHYRCHIGHAYSERDLDLRQSESIEQTLWVAVRMMEERKIFFLKMSSEHQRKGLENLSNPYKKEAKLLERHIENLKSLLIEINKINTLQIA